MGVFPFSLSSGLSVKETRAASRDQEHQRFSNILKTRSFLPLSSQIESRDNCGLLALTQGFAFGSTLVNCLAGEIENLPNLF